MNLEARILSFGGANAIQQSYAIQTALVKVGKQWHCCSHRPGTCSSSPCWTCRPLWYRWSSDPSEHPSATLRRHWSYLTNRALLLFTNCYISLTLKGDVLLLGEGGIVLHPSLARLLYAVVYYRHRKKKSSVKRRHAHDHSHSGSDWLLTWIMDVLCDICDY